MHSGNRKIVVQLIDSIHRGGVQKVALEIARNLPEYEHIVCHWTDEDDLEEEFLSTGARLVRMPFNGINTFPNTYFFLRKLVKVHQPYVVHAHMLVPNLLMRWLPGNFRRISTYHGEVLEMPGWRGSIAKALERLTLYRTDAIVAVSDCVRKYLKERLHTSRQITLIHNFAKAANVSRSRKLSVPLRVLSTSNNQPYKDYPLLIEAMSRFTAEEVTLDVYGSGMAPLIEKCKNAGIDNVRFLGSVQDVTKAMDGYSAFIITSRSGEGFSLSLLEAMSAGLPVICSDLPQFIEAVGDSAIVFRKGDVESLVEQLRQLIHEPKKLEGLSSAAIGRSELFSKDTFVQKMRDLYN